jgi:hypothetical protein
MSEARVGLVLAGVALIISLLTAGVPFYYQFLRAKHQLRVAIVKWGYADSKLSVAAAFINQGNKDEILLNVKPIVSADKAKLEWQTTIEEIDWLRGVGNESFIIPAGAVVIRRTEVQISDANLPFLEVDDKGRKAKKTDVGIHILYLARDAEVVDKTFYFASIRTVAFPKELSTESGAAGHVHSRTEPRTMDLLKY